MSARESGLTLAVLGLGLAGMAAAGTRGAQNEGDSTGYRQEKDTHTLHSDILTAGEFLAEGIEAYYDDGPSRRAFYKIDESMGYDEVERVMTKKEKLLLEKFSLKREDFILGLSFLEIKPENRMKGLGKETLERAEAYARNAGLKAVLLHAADIGSGRHPRRFWEKMGFKKIVGEPGELDAIMVKVFEPSLREISKQGSRAISPAAEEAMEAIADIFRKDDSYFGIRPSDSWNRKVSWKTSGNEYVPTYSEELIAYRTTPTARSETYYDALEKLKQLGFIKLPRASRFVQAGKARVYISAGASKLTLVIENFEMKHLLGKTGDMTPWAQAKKQKLLPMWRKGISDER